MKTWSAKPGEVDRNWFVVDASTYNLGRLASKIATVIRGKNKVTFTPHVDTGDFVVVINASKVNLTGRKLDQKEYNHYTGFPGGLKTASARDVRENDPERMITEAVAGMLPKNKLARKVLIRKIRVYAGAEHPHSAQNPQPLP